MLKFKGINELVDWCFQNLSYEQKRRVGRTAAGKFGRMPLEVSVFSADGSLLFKAPSLLEASKKLDITHNAIRYCLRCNSIFRKQYYFSLNGKFTPNTERKQRNSYMGWNDKPIHAFSILGELVKTYPSAAAAAKELATGRHTIDTARKRCSLWKSTYYFSHDHDFVLPKPKKYNRNPLLR